MRKVSTFLVLLILGSACCVPTSFAQNATKWPLVNCATNSPCTVNSPTNTHTGDSLPAAMAKLNTDINQIALMLGPSSNLANNGYVTAADIIRLWTGCAPGTPVLGYQGACVAGGSGSSGVTALSGDGALFTNSASTGAVTLTLGSAPGYGVWGNDTSSTATPGYTQLLSWPAAAFPTLNQNTTGTAANITATSNATLTTLSALSLPVGQLTGILPIANGGTGTSTPSLVAGTNVTITGTWPNQTITASSTAATAFSALTTGTNTTATMTVGTGASILASGTGSITATAAPLSGLTGLGTGVSTALAVNTGSSGAFVVNGGALGTPSSGVGTNITGVNAASVGGFTLPCTVPSLVSGDYLTNNGTTCSWAAVSGSGTINPAAQYATPYYSAAGSSTTLSGLASPTAGAGVYALHYDPTSTTAVAPTLDQVGAHTRSISGSTTTDTVLYSDVLGLILHDKAATGTVNETLPTPSSLNNTSFAYTYCNDSPQTDTITPTTYTIAVNGGTAGASIPVPTGVCAQISVDPFNSTQWDAFTFGSSNASVDALASGSTVTPSCAYKVNTVTSTAYTIAAPTASAATTATTGGTSLAASTTYYVVVTATTASGETILGTVESVTTGTGTTNTVTANWTDVAGATGYNVYISTATITAGEASVAYQTATSTATSSTFTAIPATTKTTPSTNTSGLFTVNAPTGCTPYTGQKMILIVQSASGGTLSYAASGYLTGSTTGAWPANSGAASKDDHFVLIYDGYLGTPGWTLDGYNLGL